MFENPRRDRQARNLTTHVPKILDLRSSSEQIFSENWRWVPLIPILLQYILKTLLGVSFTVRFRKIILLWNLWGFLIPPTHTQKTNHDHCMLSARASGYLYNALSLNKGPESMIFIFSFKWCMHNKRSRIKVSYFFFSSTRYRNTFPQLIRANKA